jgi:uncharacterized protein (DUF305 family)
MRPITGYGAWLGVLLAAVLAIGLAACGGDDQPDGGRGNPTEQAFLKAMIPHHEAAVEMAEIAQDRGQHREVKRLADSIIETQTDEIRRMETLHERLFGAEVVPDPEAHDELGLSAEAAGAEHTDVAELETSRPFDRAFIDMMVPHHQGAIRMARAVLAKSDDGGIRALARAIIDAQAREIRQMNEWRSKWYGARSPAGGVPKKSEVPLAGEGEHH